MSNAFAISEFHSGLKYKKKWQFPKINAHYFASKIKININFSIGGPITDYEVHKNEPNKFEIVKKEFIEFESPK